VLLQPVNSENAALAAMNPVCGYTGVCVDALLLLDRGAAAMNLFASARKACRCIVGFAGY
jgi:hypothetical protein